MSLMEKMVDPIPNLLLTTLRDLLIVEAKFLLNVKYELKKVEEDLSIIHAWLMDADAKKNRADSATFRNFMDRLEKLALRAENVLETYAIEVHSKYEGNFIVNLLRCCLCFACDCRNLHKVGKEIEDIRSSLANLAADKKSIASGGGGPSNSPDQEQRRRLRYAHEVDPHFVGMEKDIDSLVSMVKDDSNDSKSVISICGMGGLGKTTLARKIYHHQDVRGRFGSRAWVCLTQQFQAETTLREIFTQIDADKAKEAQTFDALVRGLYEVLVQRKCLIVMDDIWEDADWEEIEAAFPKENCKVVLTTRSQNVASHSHQRHLHMLGSLSEDEGWELLGKIALPTNLDGTKVAVDRRLEAIGRTMVKKCGGLPLAISVIGGILCQKKQSFGEWEGVSRQMDAYLNHGGEGTGEYKKVKQILDLSYDVLPYYLKPCFLYLSCFSEDEEIETEQLYLLWMAEGLVFSEERENSESLRDVAERYLGELALRCLVQVERCDPNMACKMFASCRVHDLMRELCSSQAKKEKFIKRIDLSSHQNHIPPSDGTFINRLAINLVGDRTETVGDEMKEVGIYPEVKNLRSLLAFKKDLIFAKFDTDLKNSKHLRILVVDNFFLVGEFYICKLFHLRYLSLRRSCIWSLPRHVYKFPYLQTLDLRVTGALLRLPNIICKMKNLRHLYLPAVDKIEVIGGGKLRLNGLDKLETLEGINSSSGCIEHIIKLKNLRQLFAVLKGERDMDSVSKNVDYISECDQLRETRLLFRKCDLPSSLIQKVINIRSLFSLEVVDCNLNQCIFPSCTQGQRMYQNLVQLRIYQFGVDVDLQSKMIFGADSFPVLKILHLLLPNLCEWKVERGAMPELRELFIQSCKKLERLPEELLSISTLQILRFRNMSLQFWTHALQTKHHFPNLTVFEV